MSLTAIILIGVAIIQFILEHSKKNQTNDKTTKINKHKKGVLVENIDIENDFSQNYLLF